MSTLTVKAGAPGPVPALAAVPHPAWRDTAALVARALRRSVRTPDALVMGIALPVMLMLLFVYVFGGALGGGGRYVDYVVPGILLLCAGYGASTTAVAVAQDVSGGLLTRLRAMPVRASSVLTGHVVESVARNTVSTVLVVGVALAAGFRPTAGVAGWLGTVMLVGFWVLALTWVAVAMGLVASSPESASAFSFVVMFVPYVSSAFVPPDTMPSALAWVATYQPVTPITDTVRAWLVGAPGANPWVALAWCGALLAVARAWALVAYRRRVRG